MAYPDKINALVDVSADETLAAGGHAARHNDVNDALDELKAVFTAPAANELGFAPDGSTESVRITSAGNVGIGTTNPATARLVVQGSNVSGAVAAHVKAADGGATVGLLIDGDADATDTLLRVRSANDANPTDADTRLLINGFGAVMIGTTSPGSAVTGDLVVNGGVFLGGNAAANELDDYEEGTWTPTFTPSGTDFTSVTYDPLTSGYYTKIGRLVHVSGIIRTDAITVGSASGAVRILGLPFNVVSLSGNADYCSAYIGNSGSFAGDNPSAGLFMPGTSAVVIYYRTTANGGVSEMNVADFGTGANANQIYFSGSYMTA